MNEIINKYYNISAPEYHYYGHYKDILKDFANQLEKSGIKRTDYEDLDFDGAEGVYIFINNVTNPKAWKILENDFGYEPSLWYDKNGNEYEQ